MRDEGTFVFSNLKTRQGVAQILAFAEMKWCVMPKA
jgi:hypothetical protein